MTIVYVQSIQEKLYRVKSVVEPGKLNSAGTDGMETTEDWIHGQYCRRTANLQQSSPYL